MKKSKQIDPTDELSPSEDGVSSSSASDVPDTDSEDEAGYLDKFTDDVKVIIEALKSVEKKQTLLENEYQRELLQLEKKYTQLVEPLYERRKALIDGSSKPSVDEIVEGENILKEELGFSPPPRNSAVKYCEGIPHFWLTVLQHSVDVAEMIVERDIEPLKHLIDVEYSYITDAPDPNPGFKLSFYFEPNEYLQNSVLEKTYFFKKGSVKAESIGGDFQFERSVGTDIDWMPGKTLTGDGLESFFNFFHPPVLPFIGDVVVGKITQKTYDRIEQRLEVELKVGEAIKDDIVPNALDLFIYPADNDDQN